MKTEKEGGWRDAGSPHDQEANPAGGRAARLRQPHGVTSPLV